MYSITVSTEFKKNIDNNQISILKLSYEGSCDTKERSNDAENSALRHKNKLQVWNVLK